MLKSFDNYTIRKKLVISFSILGVGMLIAFWAMVGTCIGISAEFKKALQAAGADTAYADKLYQNAVINASVISVAVIVFVVTVILLIIHTIKFIRVSVQDVQHAIEEVSLGNVEVNVTKYGDDEVGKLADATMVMINTMKKQAEAAQRVADGDLTVRINTKSEKDVLNQALKQLVESNNQALLEMRTAAGQVSDGSDQVAAASQALAQGSTEQASAITQITASIEDIAERTKVNAADANNANNLVITAKDDATLGNTRMNDMIAAMAEINESSESISKIIKVIDDIAFQTNILALNAAVEAARAGAHGKGFGVVAEEVRNLAGKSAQAASETAELIEDSIKKVNRGSKLAEETADALKEIMNAIDQVAAITGSIAEASNDQATAVAQIDQAIGQVSIVVQNNSSTSEECAAASEELSAQALKLTEMIGHYKLDDADEGARTYSRMKNEPKRDRNVRTAGLIEKKEDELVISLDDGFGKY